MEENLKNKSQQQPDSCINENHKASASKGMMIGMAACAVLGLGGLGFGVYELTQVNSAKRQISDLKVEVKNNDGSTTTLETDKIEVKEDTKTITITDTSIQFKNPIVYSREEQGFAVINNPFSDTEISISSGQVGRCWHSGTPDECEIVGLSGKLVYKVVAILVGQALSEDDIFAFIMEDGSVEYALLDDYFNSDKSKITIKGVLKTDKPVSDIIKLNSCSGGGCGSGAAIIFNDGTYQVYDKTMLE